VQAFEFAGIHAFLGVPMGIRFLCPNGHKLNVKRFLAGKRAICPQCGAKVVVPDSSETPGDELPPAAKTVANPFAGAPGLGSQSPLDSASPSVIIAVAPSEVAAPPVVSSTTATGPPPLPNVGGLPESVFVAPSTVTDVVDPVTSSEMQKNLRRDNTRRNQMAMAVILLIVVIVLAVVLIWVLNRDGSAPTSEEPTKAGAAGRVAPFFIAADSDILMCSDLVN